MKRKSIRPEFVDFIPDAMEEGVLYISVRYATASHKCACGCGEVVVTPIKPTDWTLTWSGETVSLNPSIGNWGQPCQSHYWIVDNRIIWASKWSYSEIAANRAKDRRAKARYYNTLAQRNRPRSSSGNSNRRTDY
jgi:hypothetical protein